RSTSSGGCCKVDAHLTQTRDTSAATVEGDERLRIFCALRLPEEALDAVEEWQAAHLVRGRVVPRRNLHVTLAFLGHLGSAVVPTVGGALAGAASAASPIVFRCGRYRETRSVGMIELDDVTGAATTLAEDLFGRLEEVGL